jgi:LysR family transcriptional activator of mexEF-oprN operon
MNESYGRDLDLNLLRVFVVVASAGSVTQAAGQLYLTQPAVSAALRRLQASVGVALFARSGRGLTLTQRGEQLLLAVRPLLEGMVEATLSPARFELATSERVLRIGMSDAMEGWLLPALLKVVAERAPRMRLITVPVQFRTIAQALGARSIDLAVTVADELPASVRRQTLITSGFVCMYDPRVLRLKASISEREYFAHQHVIVSYNGDLRGIVEDMLQKERDVRCAVSSFSHVGSILTGQKLLATVPSVVARHLCALHPKLAVAQLPFPMQGAPIELLWPLSLDDDPACGFVREQLVLIAQRHAARTEPGRRARKK